MLFQIRPFEDRDAADWARIFHTAVHGIACRDYTVQQLAAWSPTQSSAARVLEHVNNHHVWVAVDTDGTAQAFIELEPDGHIDCFYCAPNVAGLGVGHALYSHLEISARALKIPALHVEASETAKPFFKKRGFQCLTRQIILKSGVEIHNYRMNKTL